MAGFSLDLALTGKCAGCGQDFPDWEERTKGAGEPVKLEGADTHYVVETAQKCDRCRSTRVRVTLRIG